ncbi:MAG: RNA methyltransferase [bacterium]|nr:RNA methyltransferase [bacterium]
MLTKAAIKFVKSLEDKSIRHANKLFVAEGSKSLLDLLSSNLVAQEIFALELWLQTHAKSIPEGVQVNIVSSKEMSQLSQLKSPREVIGLFQMLKFRFEPKQAKGLFLALDTIQDPGNLGTLIRLADWYGIQQILCTPETADCFSPKVIQSTMGSIGRVALHYGDLAAWFKEMNIPVIAASMEGVSARKYNFPENMILLLGNEGSGISASLAGLVSETVSIERIGLAESLNAAVAGAILVDRYFGQFSK